jgi:hypothetical protein
VLGYFHLHALQNNGNRLFTLPARPSAWPMN